MEERTFLFDISVMLPQGAEAIGNSPEEFSTHIKSELAKWAQVVKSIGAKPH